MKFSFHLILLIGALLLSCSADSLRNPVTEETQKTQHFVKYNYRNSAAVPVTVKVNASGSNLKTSKTMPYIFVIPPRGSKEAFQTSAKDPRSYYSAPTVDLEHQIGDYRLGASNMKLELPWESGKSATVESVTRNALAFQLEDGQKVVAGRQGLVVSTEKKSVTVAHNDGSVTIYGDLSKVSAKLNQQVRAGQELGTSGEGSIKFQVAVPGQNLEYRALPAKFTIGGRKTTVSQGEKLTK